MYICVYMHCESIIVFICAQCYVYVDVGHRRRAAPPLRVRLQGTRLWAKGLYRKSECNTFQYV